MSRLHLAVSSNSRERIQEGKEKKGGRGAPRSITKRGDVEVRGTRINPEFGRKRGEGKGKNWESHKKGWFVRGSLSDGGRPLKRILESTI